MPKGGIFMGQYFKFVNFDKKEMISPYDYDNVAKVMEHSYQGNKFLAAAEKLIKTDWAGDRVLYLGDYVDEYYNEPKMKEVLSQLVKEVRKEKLFEEKPKENLYFVKFKEIKIPISQNDLIPSRFIYNDKTQEYIDLKKQTIQWAGCDKGEIYGVKIHPLSIMLCASNGSGGSYYGKNMELVGNWVNSLGSIGFSDSAPNDYKELMAVFDETNTVKSNKEILKDAIDEAVLKHNLKDVNKLSFDKSLFLDNAEKEELQNYAKESINKTNKLNDSVTNDKNLEKDIVDDMFE